MDIIKEENSMDIRKGRDWMDIRVRIRKEWMSRLERVKENEKLIRYSKKLCNF